MRTLTGVFLALAIAAGTGLGLTAVSVGRGSGFGMVQIGVWTATPKAGMPEIDPYARATYARLGALPLALADGMMLVAEADDGGRPLSSACTYRVVGPTPAARLWTLSATAPDFTPTTRDQRRAFTSQEVVRLGPEAVDVVVSGAARAGNWLPSAGFDRVALVLRLYDVPLATTFQPGTPLPRIQRVSCP